jgi:hypothetical protein
MDYNRPTFGWYSKEYMGCIMSPLYWPGSTPVRFAFICKTTKGEIVLITHTSENRLKPETSYKTVFVDQLAEQLRGVSVPEIKAWGLGKGFQEDKETLKSVWEEIQRKDREKPLLEKGLSPRDRFIKRGIHKKPQRITPRYR